MSVIENNFEPETLITRFLSGEASQEEQAKLQAWIDVDPLHRKLFEQYRELWEKSENVLLFGKIDTSREWNLLKQRIENDFTPIRKTGFSHTLIFRLAAVIVIALLTGFMTRYLIREYSPIRLTADQSVSAFTLPDGSEITLDKGSTLTYNRKFNTSGRLVRLKGTAYFDVVHNQHQQFVTEIGAIRVTVLGTAFAIEASNPDKNIAVVVDRGRVSMEEEVKGDKIILTPGDVGEWNAHQTSLVKHRVSDSNYLAWKTKHIVLNDVPLSDVLVLLRKVYHINFSLRNPEASHCHVTAEFDDESVDTVLDIICGVLDMSWEKTNDGILLTGKGCQD